MSIWILSGYQSGSSLDHTGSPHDANQAGCAVSGCHDSYSLNSGTGSLAKIGTNHYVPGDTYSFTLVVSQSVPIPDEYGFMAVALRDDSSAGGTFLPGSGSDTFCLGGRSYVQHTANGTSNGVWMFQWKAPNYMDTIRIYMGGLAANDDNSADDDYAYKEVFEVYPLLPLQVTTQSDSTSCHGVCDGSALAIATGGPGPHFYHWSNGMVGNMVTDLCEGFYNVTVSNPQGQSVLGTVFVPSPDPIDLTLTSGPVVCGEGGFVGASAAGGAEPYTYHWNDSTSSMEDSVFALDSGMYTTTVTDINGCTQSDSVAVEVVSQEMYWDSVKVYSANEQFCDGAAAIFVSGGVGPYSYQWSDQSAPTGSMRTELCAGTYLVMVWDSSGCMIDTLVNIPIVLGRFELAEDELHVYPNPVRDKLRLNTFGSGDHAVMILTPNGDIVMSEKLDLVGGQAQMDVHQLTPGVYVLQVDESRFVRFVKH